jgi:hypothetical protein
MLACSWVCPVPMAIHRLVNFTWPDKSTRQVDLYMRTGDIQEGWGTDGARVEGKLYHPLAKRLNVQTFRHTWRFIRCLTRWGLFYPSPVNPRPTLTSYLGCSLTAGFSSNPQSVLAGEKHPQPLHHTCWSGRRPPPGTVVARLQTDWDEVHVGRGPYGGGVLVRLAE